MEPLLMITSLREEAGTIRERNRWNYNPIETAVNDAIASALEGVADRIEDL